MEKKTDGATRAVEQMTRASGEFYKVVMDHSVSLGEHNVRIAREMNRELVEAALRQQGAFQTLVRQSVDAYMSFLFAPFSLAARGGAGKRSSKGTGTVDDLRLPTRSAASGNGTNDGLPLRDYDGLTVERVSEKIAGLDAEEVAAIREYEKNNKNRETLLERLDRSLV